jgi:hypothetical protein
VTREVNPDSSLESAFLTLGDLGLGARCRACGVRTAGGMHSVDPDQNILETANG